MQQLQTEVKDLQPKVDKANKERTELEAVGKKHEQTINSTTVRFLVVPLPAAEVTVLAGHP